MPVPEVDRGPFLEGLDWLQRLPQPVFNVARGNVGAAGRTLLDLGGDVVDAALPFDVIPHTASPEDTVQPHELLDIDPEESPALSRITDIVGNTVANPATYLTGGVSSKGLPTYRVLGGMEVPGVASGLQSARSLAQKGWERLPESIRTPVSQAAATAKRSLNWLDIAPKDRATLTQAAGRGNITNRVNLKAVEEAYAGLSPAEQEAVGELVHGIARKGSQNRADWQLAGDVDQYLAARPELNADAVKRALEARRTISQNQLKDPGIFSDNGIGQDGDYLSRQFSGFKPEAPDQADIFGQPSAIKARNEELKTPQGLLKYLQESPDIDLEFNALKSDAARAQQQGRLAERAVLGKSVTGMDDFTLSNPQHVAKMREVIKGLESSSPDFAYRLGNAFNGIKSRSDNWFAQGLAAANRVFKSAATYGVLLPRIAFNVRNRIGGLWQALSTDGARGTLGSSSRRALSDLLGAFDDGYKQLSGSRLTGSQLTKNLDAIDAALQNTGGSVEKFRQQLSQAPNGAELVSALDNGVLDNFVSSEELLTRMAGDKRWYNSDILTWPSAIGQGLEQRMRLGTYLDLLKGGKSPQEAAQIIKDTYLDYGVAGQANRTARDILPFLAFTSQTIPQQAKFLAKYPGVAVGASQLLGSGDEDALKYPSLENQVSIPAGLDESGNAQFITGTGLPIETLTQIPGLSGDDAYRDIVGNLQPILKTGIAAIAGKDPYTGNDFGTYSKIIGQEAGSLGRAYNIIAGTGLTQPLSSLASPVTNILDERKSVPEKLLTGLTGVKLQSVDPDLAKRQQIERFLRSRPDIKSVESFYQTDEKDPEVTAVMQQLQDAKDRLKKKRDAAKISQ